MRQRGLSLIEMSITLFIVGLLTSLFVRGQELITQARIKSIAADFNQARIAVDIYKDRYGQLPGEDDRVNRWTGLGVTATPGVPDGQVSGTFNAIPSVPPTSSQETNLFWWHLRLSGILAGPTDATFGPRQPVNFLGGILGVQGTGTTLGIPGLVLCSSNLPAPVAAGVDLIIDEGTGTAGDVRAVTEATATAGLPTAGPGQAYDESSNESYIICKSLTR